MRASHKTAIGGISSASGVIIIYLLSFIPGFGLVSAMIMGFLLVFVREIAGRLTAYLTYATTALILVFLCSKSSQPAHTPFYSGIIPFCLSISKKSGTVLFVWLWKFFCLKVLVLHLLLLCFCCFHLKRYLWNWLLLELHCMAVLGLFQVQNRKSIMVCL